MCLTCLFVLEDQRDPFMSGPLMQILVNMHVQVFTRLFLVQECVNAWASFSYWRKSICIGLYSCIQLVVGSARSFFQLLDSYVFHVLAMFVLLKKKRVN